MSTPDQNTFEALYAGQPPWDIGRAQSAFVQIADRIVGSILDVGCGTGDAAIYFASRGHRVTGIDFLPGPIERARQKGLEQGVTATFLVLNALNLGDLPEVFDNLIDSGLFHVFSDDDRRRYVEQLASVVRPGGHLFLLCFNDAEPPGQGPRRISRNEIEIAFANGWRIIAIEPIRFEIRPDSNDMGFSAGGPKAWFVEAERISHSN